MFQNAGSQPVQRQGSIIVVIATDAPLDVPSLQQIANPAGVGIAQTGSYLAITSGDFAVAFSITNVISMNETAKNQQLALTLYPQILDLFLKASVEAVVEAQLNALVASHSND